MDRNEKLHGMTAPISKSLSARRAWIEIDVMRIIKTNTSRSLSARRAWIEMRKRTRDEMRTVVALRKESVDRNVPFDVIRPAIDGRSPQGERG